MAMTTIWLWSPVARTRRKSSFLRAASTMFSFQCRISTSGGAAPHTHRRSASWRSPGRPVLAGLARFSPFPAGLVETLGERVPRERGALDPHRELDHALQGLEVTERHAGRRLRTPPGTVAVLGLGPVAADRLLVD